LALLRFWNKRCCWKPAVPLGRFSSFAQAAWWQTIRQAIDRLNKKLAAGLKPDYTRRSRKYKYFVDNFRRLLVAVPAWLKPKAESEFDL
jgi:hypothetical protein